MCPSLWQNLLPAPQSSSPAPLGRSTVFPWHGVVMAMRNVTTAAMRRTVRSAQPSSSSVIKEVASMLRGAATESQTVLITLMSRTVKVGSHMFLIKQQNQFTWLQKVRSNSECLN